VAGVALGDIDRHFAWQAYGTGLALMARWPRLAPWSPRLFAWQAWRLATSTIVSDGLEAVGILSSSVKCIIILDIYFTHTCIYTETSMVGQLRLKACQETHLRSSATMFDSDTTLVQRATTTSVTTRRCKPW